MKTKRWVFLLAAVVAALAMYAAVFAPDGGVLVVLALPFRWLGLGLRSLSLSGTAGNIAAIVLMTMFCLLPLLPVFLDARKKQKAVIEHIVCVLTAAILPFLLYRFVNPQLIRQIFPEAWPSPEALTLQGELMLSLCFWSLAAAYAVLRALRAYGGSAAEKGLKAVLVLLTGAMLVSVFYIDLYKLIGEIRTAASSYSAEPFTGGGFVRAYPAVDCLLAALRFSGSAVPSLLLLRVFPVCFRLLREIEKDRFAAGNAQLALDAAKKARAAIMVSVLLSAAVNIVQMLLTRLASNVNISVDLPLFEMLTAFLLILLSEGFRKGHELADENRQFV